MGQNIIDLCSIVLELIRTISEVQFALKDEGAKFLESEPLNGSGSQSVALDLRSRNWLDDFIDSLANASAS